MKVVNGINIQLVLALLIGHRTISRELSLAVLSVHVARAIVLVRALILLVRRVVFAIDQSAAIWLTSTDLALTLYVPQVVLVFDIVFEILRTHNEFAWLNLLVVSIISRY